MTKYQLEQRDRLRKNIQEDTHEGPLGELRWNSNQTPVPMDIFRDADLEAPRAQEQAVKANTETALEEYREAQIRRTPEQLEEEAFERRAAFGPGVDVVNIITGERTRT